MSHKHIFNSPDGLVLKSLRGAAALNPLIRLHAPSKSVYVAHPSPSLALAVITGGGAGHEPAHAGYTGAGMLTASVSGDIFASPSAKQILACIQLAAFNGAGTPRDVLIVINNYTGDRLNFGLAIEQARALHPAINIATVLVADDVSLLGRPSLVGPRGLGGNIFVCKVLGAFAAAGGTLTRTKHLGDALVANLRSIGAALGHCHVPGRSSSNANDDGRGSSDDDDNDHDDGIAPGHVEIGLGLHNEPGVRRAALASPTWLVREMVRLVRESGEGWARVGGGSPASDWIRPDDQVVLFINNLGGVSQLEMSAVVDEVVGCLSTHTVHPVRVYLAPFMTSLNAPGFSISLVNVTRTGEQLEAGDTPAVDLLALLDAPTDAHAWTGVRVWPVSPPLSASDKDAEDVLRAIQDTYSVPSSSGPETTTPGSSATAAAPFTPPQLTAALRAACAAVRAAERDMTRFDTVVGDGDCGETFAGGARAVLAALDSGSLNPSKTAPAALVAGVGAILEGNMGGTIGALFAIFFTAWSRALRSPSPESASSLSAALKALGAHTPARPGDRTVVDALAPLCAALDASSSTPLARLEAAARAARAGAESTRGMGARLGRASYVAGESGDGVEGDNTGLEGVPPDPGAWGVAVMMEGFVAGVKA
ncbi:DAK1 DegV-like protein [Hygrophoropsis aurantiaca]|uniref:DAK1 DegV-like protein n=1 Tax=Hygrophoropsis aurantiaca TaxID=72124 RepID=A0ACB7ZTR8_9AGAM|nr:DAK1 DegV-like protein [Hygrophoropsis aurantiaca]